MKFEDAINYVLQWEGGYSNDQNDLGSETNWGISKRSHPNIDIKSLTREQAIEIYRKEYWEPYLFEKIVDEKITRKFFDMSINLGISQATLIMQESLNLFHRNLKEDGIFGEDTLLQINMTQPQSLITAIISKLDSFYRQVVKDNPSQQKYLAGWLWRAKSW